MERYLRALGQVLGAALIVCLFWPTLGMIIITVTVIMILALVTDDYNIAARVARRRARKRIAERADAQNRAFIRGDFRYGLYGNFPPRV